MAILDSQQIYRARIHRVIDFITQNLASELDLGRLATEASFSPFHFHRIFTAFTGETPNEFINRLRLERTANLLVKTKQPITHIALDCGFSSSATFARAFRQHFGVSASAYRQSGTATYPTPARPPIPPGESSSPFLYGAVRVIEQPALPVIYAANLAGYSIEAICVAWNQLTRWASSHNLIQENTRMVGVSFDDPNITPIEKCRYYACLSVPAGTPIDSQMGYMEIPGGLYAVGRFFCPVHQIQDTYMWFFGSWLPGSGCQPSDRTTFEIYLQTPEMNPEGCYLLEVYIPIEPLCTDF